MKKAFITTVQVLITIALLWWVFRSPEKRAEMLEALRTADHAWLAAGLAILAGLILASVQRWRLLLNVQNIFLPFRRVGQLFMIGFFFNIFLPGGTGGDIVKLFYLFREAPDKKLPGFLSIVVDRVTGLLALMSITAVFATLCWSKLMATPETRGFFGLLVAMLAISFFIILAAVAVNHYGLAHKLPQKLPFRARIIEMATAFEQYARAPRALFFAYLCSLVAQSSLFLSVYFCARAFTDKLSVIDIFGVLPIIIVITSLPISIAGIGVRESTTEQLLSHMYGIPEHVAVLISISGFLLIVCWALVGGLAYVFYKSPDGRHVKIRDMEKEVHDLEGTVDKTE